MVGDITNSRRFATILLVDARGWVLLQERDERAPRAPGLWGMVGGHVDAGEDVDRAAYRELAEETGLRLADGSLQVWRDDEFRYADGYGGRYRVHAARVDLSDADVVVGEGRQIVFVKPDTIADLALTPSARHFVVPFLQSSFYATMRTQRPVAAAAIGDTAARDSAGR